MTLLHENIVGIDSAIFMHPTIWKASGHVDAFNDPLIDNRDSKKRYRADVLIEDQVAKYDEKIAKEVAKAAKRFGDAFDEAQFRATNARVLDLQARRDALHERYSTAMNANDLAELRQIILDEEIVCPISGHQELDRGTPIQPYVQDRDGLYSRRFYDGISASRDCPGYLRELSQCSEDRPYAHTIRYRPRLARLSATRL